MKKPFFVNCPNNGFETFETIEERDAAAKECIEAYLYDGWDEEVTQVVAGEISHKATQVDRVNRPAAEDLDEEECDSDGYHWGDFDHYCNYKLQRCVTKV